MATSSSAGQEGPGNAEAGPAPEPADLIQYVVLRSDLWKSLSWPLGSVVAQACHAATAALWLSRGAPDTLAYCAPDRLDRMHKARREASAARGPAARCEALRRRVAAGAPCRRTGAALPGGGRGQHCHRRAGETRTLA
jgi:hypothetical protein